MTNSPFLPIDVEFEQNINRRPGIQRAILQIKERSFTVPVKVETLYNVRDARSLLEGRLWAYDRDLFLNDPTEALLDLEDGRSESTVLLGSSMSSRVNEPLMTSMRFLHEINFSRQDPA